MLKEIDISEMPEGKSWGRGPTEVSEFCSRTLDEFMRSGIDVAEVTGWPGGDPKTSTQAASRHSSMQSKIRVKKIEGVKSAIRGKRLFLVKEGGCDER